MRLYKFRIFSGILILAKQRHIDLRYNKQIEGNYGKKINWVDSKYLKRTQGIKCELLSLAHKINYK